MIHQLRIYEIFEHHKEAFHNRFRDHASRIMRSYGFNILETWETKLSGQTEFVYLLAWPDEQTMRSAWERFKADEEWKQIKKTTNAPIRGPRRRNPGSNAHPDRLQPLSSEDRISIDAQCPTEALPRPSLNCCSSLFKGELTVCPEKFS